MKAVIVDGEVLRSISPLEATAYLRSRGWKMTERLGEKGAVWVIDSDDGEVEIILPLDRTLHDFAGLMRDALEALAKIENRSQLEVLSDITLSSADVVRLTLRAAATHDGSSPIESGFRLIEHSYALILAAACSTSQPRSLYQARKPQEAVDYMKKVRLGQTERGSFVLTAYSVVPPRLHSSGVDASVDLEEPFERRVMLKLASALHAVREAASQAGATGDLSPFTEAISLGVSANLCDAVVRIVADSGEQSLEFEFS
jgi:hypothetical protein